MTLAVDLGRKATKQTNKTNQEEMSFKDISYLESRALEALLFGGDNYL